MVAKNNLAITTTTTTTTITTTAITITTITTTTIIVTIERTLTQAPNTIAKAPKTLAKTFTQSIAASTHPGGQFLQVNIDTQGSKNVVFIKISRFNSKSKYHVKTEDKST